MVMKKHQERNKHLNRSVFNDWSLYTFVQILIYKCQKNGKDLQIIANATAQENVLLHVLWTRDGWR